MTFQCENAFEETGEWKMNYEAGMSCDEAAELETESNLTIELVQFLKRDLSLNI